MSIVHIFFWNKRTILGRGVDRRYPGFIATPKFGFVKRNIKLCRNLYFKHVAGLAKKIVEREPIELLSASETPGKKPSLMHCSQVSTL